MDYPKQSTKLGRQVKATLRDGSQVMGVVERDDMDPEGTLIVRARDGRHFTHEEISKIVATSHGPWRMNT